MSTLDDLLGYALGDAGDAYGPAAPADLANLDRTLTSSEQGFVDQWQIAQANEEQAKEEAAGGPRAKATVDAQGAHVAEQPSTWLLVAAIVVGGAWYVRRRRRGRRS